MFFAASLLSLLLALPITGSPVKFRNSALTLPLTKRLHFSSNGTINLLQHDKARVATLRNYNRHGRRADADGNPTPSNFFDFTIAIGVGTPPTTYELIMDAGSANTWVGGSTPYAESSTSINTTQLVEVVYSDALSGTESIFSGTIFLDTFTSANSTVTNFPFGVASTSTGIDADGILGIGPQDLTLGSLTDLATSTFPTFTNYLYNQGQIPNNAVSIFFPPITANTTDATITFGEPDSSLYTGNISYTAITTTAPASNYWGINQSITYGSSSTSILVSTAGIVDSGSAFISIASDAYANYQAATGATADPATGLLTISSEQYSTLQNLDFHIGGNTFSLTPDGQIWPRSLNTKLNGPGVDGAIYLIITNIGTLTGEGFDFINGYAFIQRFYTVFDTANSQVGFASTQFTDATTN